MSNKIVKNDKFEINKPSELCQVMYFEDRKKGVFANFSAIEIDMVNLILYKSREKVMRSKEPFDPKKIFELELLLSDIVKTFGKYNSTSYDPLIQNLRNLRAKEVVINALGKNKNLNVSYTSIIHKVQLSKHRDKKLKCVRLQIDTELVSLVMNVKDKFSKMFLDIQYGFSLKYSKLLYEVLKDYIGIKQIVLNYDLLMGLLNVKNTKRYSKYSYFNGEILKPALKEINEQSDILVEYEPVKEKFEGQRKQVTKIKFKMKSQSETRLQELGLVQKSITEHQFYNKSKSKLDRLIRKGYKVIDEKSWITSDIGKNEDRYEAENRVDVWLKDTEKEDQKEVYEMMASSLEHCDDPVVIIEDYKVTGVFSKEAYSRNANETIEMLNNIIADIS